MSPTTKVDRAALVRRALIELVAENGFRGTSMAAVAERAGVATGTAYVHYASKDDLVLAGHLEVKNALGAAGRAAVQPSMAPAEMFRKMWLAMYEFLAADPVQARFLLQVETSPYAPAAHEAALDAEAILTTPQMETLMAAMIDLPIVLLYDLGLGPAIRVAAAQIELTADEIDLLAAACWRAVSGPT